MTGTLHPHPDDLTYSPDETYTEAVGLDPTSPPAAPSGSIPRLSVDRLADLLGEAPSPWAMDLAVKLALADWHEHGGGDRSVNVPQIAH